MPFTLLIDADTMVWKVLSATVSAEDTPDPHKGCLFFDRLLESYKCQMSKYFNVTETRLYLTPDAKTNFRYKLPSDVKYKENRINQPKPVGFREVKSYIAGELNGIQDMNFEADDLIAMDAAILGSKACIVGIDKDYRQCGNVWLWGTDINKPPEYANELGFLVKFAHTNGQVKLYGRGLKWLYYQLLVGDASDNIKGAKGIGPIKAYEILCDCLSEFEMYEKVVAHYEEGGASRVLNNARLLWLRRSKDEPLWTPPNA